MEEVTDNKEQENLPSTFFVPQWKQRVTISTCRRDLDEILIKIQTSDILVFLIPSTGVSNEGLDVIKVISAHGFPSMFSIVDFHENKLSKKDFESFFSLEFGEKQFKILDLEKTSEILRFICQLGLKEAPLSRNIPRPFLYSDSKPNLVDFTSPSGQEMKLIEISGFIRGGSLSPNQLVHFHQFGDFQIHSISPKADPYLVKHSSSTPSSAASSQIDISEFYTASFSEYVFYTFHFPFFSSSLLLSFSSSFPSSFLLLFSSFLPNGMQLSPPFLFLYASFIVFFVGQFIPPGYFVFPPQFFCYFQYSILLRRMHVFP